ncbi:MAG: FkbM family methyltransferase [Bacteroidota bacterium]
MKKNIYNLLLKIGALLIKSGQKGNNAIYKVAKSLYTPPVVTSAPTPLDQYYKAGGEQLRYNYILNETSLVFDLGGYEGEWAAEIYSRYRSKIYLFEVYMPFAQLIEKRFQYNPDISIFMFGLSSVNGLSKISLDENSSSIHKQTALMADIELVEATSFLKKHNITVIDLIKINIEGAEYDLLEHLIANGYHQIIKNLQVQFHNFVPDAAARMEKIREQLSATHRVTYQFDFVWENWELI